MEQFKVKIEDTSEEEAVSGEGPFEFIKDEQIDFLPVNDPNVCQIKTEPVSADDDDEPGKYDLIVKEETNLEQMKREWLNENTFPTREMDAANDVQDHVGALSKSGTDRVGSPYNDNSESSVADCSTVFSSTKELNRKAKQFQCETCSQSFPGKKNLKMHMRIHSGKKSFQCDTCSKSFSQKRYLGEHMLIHSGEKCCQCGKCCKSFTDAISLKFHMLTNNGKFPFQCNTCSKLFTCASSLKLHMLTHIVKKPFQCDTLSKKLVHDEKSAVAFLQKHGILHNPRRCKHGHDMTLSVGNRYRWSCKKGGCREFKELRKDTFLNNSNLPLRKMVSFIYYWAKDLMTVKFCEEELGLSRPTRGEWCNFLREVCADNIVVIGGPGQTVEIDECFFSRRKSDVHRVLPQQWVFGGMCRETGQCFLVAVEDRSAETLLPIISNHVRAGSIIVADEWRAYRGIQGLPENYDYRTVNHPLHFVDPLTSAPVQGVETSWRLAKHCNKMQCTDRNELDPNLTEFMWRQRYRDHDLFQQIMTDILEYWPPQ